MNKALHIKHFLFNDALPNGWEVKTVDSIKSNEKYSCSAGPFGSNISSKYFVDEGVPVIRGGNLSLGKEFFKDKNFVFVSEDKAKSFPGQHVKPGDLVFTCWGTLGQVGIIPHDGQYKEYIISNKQLKLRPDSKKCNSRFLYYYFSLPQMIRHINDIAIGAAVPGINLGLLKGIKVVLPPKIIQDKIVAILSSYDDLIDNNKRHITKLENISEEIYREWFVRYRFPGYQKIEFEKGIPKGWEEIEINKIIDFKSGFAFKSESYKIGERYGVVTIKNVHDGKFIPECSDYVAEPPSKLPKHCFINNGDILMSLTGNVGRVCLAHGNNLLLNQRVVLLRPKQENQSNFIYWLFRQKSMMTFCEMISTGAAQQNLSPIKLGAQKIIYPESKLVEKYQEVVVPLMEQIKILLEENKNLNSTKDMLLPRLISGKLLVEDLDIQFPPSMHLDEMAS